MFHTRMDPNEDLDEFDRLILGDEVWKYFVYFSPQIAQLTY